MAIDRYATRHCPVLVYSPDGNVEEYVSISECARARGLSVQQVKHYLHHDCADSAGNEYDIPVTAPWCTAAQISQTPAGVVERIRLIRTTPEYDWRFEEGKMKIIPKQDYVLLERQEESKTKSGLYIPESQDAKLLIGLVKEVAENVESIMPGQKVLYPASDATSVKVDSKTLYLVPAGSIYAVMEE